MSMSGLPFDDFRALLRELPGPDTHALVAAKERNAQLTKPAGSLGRLEEIAMWLAAWSGRSPAVNRPLSEISIGPIVRRNIPALIAQDGQLGQSLLGMSFLSTLGSLQMQTDELRLRDR